MQGFMSRTSETFYAILLEEILFNIRFSYTIKHETILSIFSITWYGSILYTFIYLILNTILSGIILQRNILVTAKSVSDEIMNERDHLSRQILLTWSVDNTKENIKK